MNEKKSSPEIAKRIANILEACASGYPSRAANDGAWLLRNMPEIKVDRLTAEWWGEFEREPSDQTQQPHRA